MEKINRATKEFFAQGAAKKIQIRADANLYQQEKDAEGILAAALRKSITSPLT
ncbi:hypothetical protein GCAAIG_05680 [Candidatus Electronema halotolerans]